MVWRKGDKPMRDDDGLEQPDPAFSENGQPFDNDFSLMDDDEHEALHERVHGPTNAYFDHRWEKLDDEDGALSDEIRQAAACSSVALIDKLIVDGAGEVVVFDQELLSKLIQSCIQYGVRMKTDYDTGLLKFSE